jgi:hypothetical protein
LAGEGAGLDHLGLAAEGDRDQAPLGQLAEHAVGVGALAIDLVDGDDDGHAGGAGVLDRLLGLGHDPVVGGDDEHGDVGDVGPAGAHGGEGGVARRVDEGDPPPVLLDLVGADPLGDAARLARGHLGLADVVEY